MKKLMLMALLGMGLFLTSCEKDDLQSVPVNLVYEFDKGAQGWTVGYSDYNENMEGLELENKIDTLPSTLNKPGKKGLMVQGHNRSDDLFMFLQRKVNGLQPNRTYTFDMVVQLASDAPDGAVGIGGSPGESVYLKMGAVKTQPAVTKNNNGYFEINVRKGQQSQGGDDMKVAGNVANGTQEFKYHSIQRKVTGLEITTNAQGECWLVVGTDSGFEGLTRLYYEWIKADLALAK